MNDLQVHYFLKTAEHMSYTKAARELFVTQPSISRQILSLEQELGVELFDRTQKSKIALTPAGMVLHDFFLRIRAEYKEVLLMAGEMAGREALSLRVGLGEGWRLGAQKQRWTALAQERYPGAIVSFETNTFKALHQRLDSDELDLIFCVQTGVQSFKNVNVYKVGDSIATAFFASTHSPVQCLADLADDPLYVLPEDEAPTSTAINRGFLIEQNLRPEIIVKPNRDSILLELSGGRGFAIFDSWTRYGDYPDIATFPLEQTIPVCAVWKKSRRNPLIDLCVNNLTAIPKAIKSRPRA